MPLLARYFEQHIVILRALQGVIFSLGAPLGWALIQLSSGVNLADDISANSGVYIYMTFGTAFVFTLFGLYVGFSECRLSKLALLDPLTNLHNKRYFKERLCEAYYQARRSGEHIWLILVDIDHFKKINDEHGHLVGDEVLEKVGRLLVESCRRGEPVSRVGGEEFCIILTGHLTSEQAYQAAERLRTDMSRLKLKSPKGNAIDVTVSAGIASSAMVDGDEWSLYSAADEAMYRAKQSGRNQVCTFFHKQNSALI